MKKEKKLKFNPRNTIKRTPGPGRPPKHGAFIIKQTKNDPRPEIRKWLTIDRQAIIEDLGGINNITAKQQLQINNALRILNVLYHMDTYMASEGVFLSRGILQPLMDRYLAHINSLSRVLQSLGLNKTLKNEGKSLDNVIDEIIKEKRK